MPHPEIKSGDLLFHRSSGIGPTLIDLATFGFGRGYSHVGIIAGHQSRPNLLLWESNPKDTKPCILAGKRVDGVQVHEIKEIYDRNAEVYHLPLRKHLTLKQALRLETCLDEYRKLDYDYIGALRAGGFYWARFNAWLHGETLDKLFCTELTALCLKQIGLIPESTNISQFSPNTFYWFLMGLDIYDKPVQIK